MGHFSECILCNLRPLYICCLLSGCLPLKWNCRCGKRQPNPNGPEVNWYLYFVSLSFHVSLFVIVSYKFYTFIHSNPSLVDNSTIATTILFVYVINATVVCSVLVFRSKDASRRFGNLCQLIDISDKIAPWRMVERNISTDVYWRGKMDIILLLSACAAILVFALSAEIDSLTLCCAVITTMPNCYVLFALHRLICTHTCLMKNCYSEIIVSLRTAPARAAHRRDLASRRRKLIAIHKLIIENFGLIDNAAGFGVLFCYLMFCVCTVLLSFIPLSILMHGRLQEELNLAISGSVLLAIYVFMTFYVTSAGEVAASVSDELLSFLYRYPISNVEENEAYFLEAMTYCLTAKIAVKPLQIITFSIKLVPSTFHSLFSYTLVAAQFYQRTLKIENRLV